jgi:hypothetical protein
VGSTSSIAEKKRKTKKNKERKAYREGWREGRGWEEWMEGGSKEVRKGGKEGKGRDLLQYQQLDYNRPEYLKWH